MNNNKQIQEISCVNHLYYIVMYNTLQYVIYYLLFYVKCKITITNLYSGAVVPIHIDY